MKYAVSVFFFEILKKARPWRGCQILKVEKKSIFENQWCLNGILLGITYNSILSQESPSNTKKYRKNRILIVFLCKRCFFFPQVGNRQIAGLAVESFYPQPLQATLVSDGGGNVQLWDLRMKLILPGQKKQCLQVSHDFHGVFFFPPQSLVNLK